MNRNIFLLFLLLLSFSFLQCEKGCTDPAAENYNPDAKKENGSCYYINLPSNLNYTITNAPNSGLVEVSATAANENFFTFVFIDGTDSSVVTSVNGEASYSYFNSGTYRIKIRANLSTSQFIEVIDSVSISFNSGGVNNTGYSTPLNYPNYTLTMAG